MEPSAALRRGERAGVWWPVWKAPDKACREQTVSRWRGVSKALHQVEGNRKNRLTGVGGGRVHVAAHPRLGEWGAAGVG